MSSKVDKRNLTIKDVEFIKKTCRALNMIASIRRDKLTPELLKESMNKELSNLCSKDSDKDVILKNALRFDEEKNKYVLNWK